VDLNFGTSDGKSFIFVFWIVSQVLLTVPVKLTIPHHVEPGCVFSRVRVSCEECGLQAIVPVEICVGTNESVAAWFIDLDFLSIIEFHLQVGIDYQVRILFKVLVPKLIFKSVISSVLNVWQVCSTNVHPGLEFDFTSILILKSEQ